MQGNARGKVERNLERNNQGRSKGKSRNIGENKIPKTKVGEVPDKSLQYRLYSKLLYMESFILKNLRVSRYSIRREAMDVSHWSITFLLWFLLYSSTTGLTTGFALGATL